jgi:hypothetical protein
MNWNERHIFRQFHYVMSQSHHIKGRRMFRGGQSYWAAAKCHQTWEILKHKRLQYASNDKVQSVTFRHLRLSRFIYIFFIKTFAMRNDCCDEDT